MQHIYLLGMHDNDDEVIWVYAKEHELVIVSKDNDFKQMFSKRGFPPAVIKLNIGNCTNERLKAVLVKYAASIKTAHQTGRLVIIED